MAGITRVSSMFLKNSLNQNCLIQTTTQKRFLYAGVRRAKATIAAEIQDCTQPFQSSACSVDDPCYNRLDCSFENGEEAFKSKSTWELTRALLVFNLCSIKPLVDKNKELMTLSRKLLGKTIFHQAMKQTFYGQFVAGEDEVGIKPLIERNRHFGVKSILDYSVEKDISREQAQKAEMESCVSALQPVDLKHTGPNKRYRAHWEFGDRREHVTGARTYFYEDEAHCDENMQTFLNSIDAVSGATNATGFAAIKLTALGRPQLLLQISEVLAQLRRYYDSLAAKTGTPAIQRKVFEKSLKSFMLDRVERKKWYTLLDVTQDGEIDLLDWTNLLEVNMSLAKLLRVPNIERNISETGQLEPLVTALTEEEEEQMKNMLHRINTILKYGKQKDVRIMIDAEQTYFQTAINRLCMEMMRKFNKDKAIVFNTYQCYLKDAYDTITTDLALAKREKFYFGCKLVRGAYMEQERKRAETLGYSDPINPSYEATTDMYERVLEEVMYQIKQRPRGEIAVMVATHNEDTVRYTVEKMKDNGIHSQDRVLCFGQLLGMCDQVSFSLGQAGYSVYKYVPYGPIDEVLPYLSRRALENKGVLDKVRKEKRLLRGELFRRILSGNIFSSVKVPDTIPPNAR